MIAIRLNDLKQYSDVLLSRSENRSRYALSRDRKSVV